MRKVQSNRDNHGRGWVGNPCTLPLPNGSRVLVKGFWWRLSRASDVAIDETWRKTAMTCVSLATWCSRKSLRPSSTPRRAWSRCANGRGWCWPPLFVTQDFVAGASQQISSESVYEHDVVMLCRLVLSMKRIGVRWGGVGLAALNKRPGLQRDLRPLVFFFFGRRHGKHVLRHMMRWIVATSRVWTKPCTCICTVMYSVKSSTAMVHLKIHLQKHKRAAHWLVRWKQLNFVNIWYVQPTHFEGHVSTKYGSQTCLIMQKKKHSHLHRDTGRLRV